MGLIGAAGCTQLEAPETPPEAEANIAPRTQPAPRVIRRSAESFALERHYNELERDLVAQGLLRQDGGGPDVPFNTRNLVENFIRIALFDEYRPAGDIMIARETESRLRKWEQPIRMKIEFGRTIPKAQRTLDMNRVISYSSRLSNLTKVPISVSNDTANFHVLLLNEDDRRAIAPRLKEIVPGISDTSIRTVVDMPRSTLCLVFAFSADAESSSYSKAIAIIRGEHPDLMRLSCIHEELAQGLGLANDSALARPSIFNDDEEFGLLTDHDEFLLKMLYDPRMKSGMTAREARPIAEKVARELIVGRNQS
ncbi:DUF2927 domain-containing protein [Parasulfitobacter algicola]|uniref:DUF2927 domain-containing protein n=1 Tax=Parasulfitobacter algicola TaxID=2614809 RepID=UPI0031B5B190